MLGIKIEYIQRARRYQFPKKNIRSSYSSRTLHLKLLCCVLLSIPDCYKPTRHKQNPVPIFACNCYKPVIKSRQKWDWLQNSKLFYKLEGQIQPCRRHALRISLIFQAVMWTTNGQQNYFCDFHIPVPNWAVPGMSGFRALHFSWQTCTSPKLTN